MTVESSVASHPADRLALTVFRLPLPLYRRGWGWLLGDTFLLLVHSGRKAGSAWGKETDWIRNIRAHPALKVQIGRESFTRGQRFLSDDESAAVVARFQRRHPHGGEGHD